jgi:hypothetical protein
MRLALFAFALLFVAGSALAQPVLYEEHFTGGVNQLAWYGATTDTLGNPFTMEPLNDPTTPGADGWAGAVTIPFDYAGTPGLAFAGEDSLADYSIEAWIYCVVETPMGPYNGIAARYDTTGGFFRLYVLRTDFDSSQRIRLTYREGATPTIIRDWSAGEIPGGVPTTSSWHKLGLKVVDNQLWAFYDDSLLAGCPYTSDTLTHGFFGIYTWNMAAEAQTRCDDIIIRDERPTGIADGPQEGMPDVIRPRLLSYPNPWLSSTSFALELPTSSSCLLQVFDVTGRLRRTLVDTPLPAGRHHVTWDARDDQGQLLPSGIYFYNLTTASGTVSGRTTLLR